MLECSSFRDNLRWNRQLYLVVKVRLFAKLPSRQQSSRSHMVWGYQHTHVCEGNRNSYHPGVWLLLETKGTSALRHHTGTALATSLFWFGPTKKPALATFCSLGCHQWVDILLAQRPLICPLQHTAVWKQCFVRLVLPPWNLPFVNWW